MHAAYVEGAESTGADVRVLDLRTLNFSLSFGGYRDERDLEPDLVAAQEAIQWADHLVFVYPVWWGAMPALLKGFIDRTFLPGFAFGYQEDSPLPARLLKGKTARIVLTMDAPVWYYRLVYKRAAEKVMRICTLEFCGVKPVAVTRFGVVSKSPPEKRESWIRDVHALGAADA